VNEDDVARRESSRDLPAFSFSYANSFLLHPYSCTSDVSTRSITGFSGANKP